MKWQDLHFVCPKTGITISSFRDEQATNNRWQFVTLYHWPGDTEAKILDKNRTKKHGLRRHQVWVDLLNEELEDRFKIIRAGGHVFPINRVQINTRADARECREWLAEHAPTHQEHNRKRFLESFISIADPDEAFAFKMRWW